MKDKQYEQLASQMSNMQKTLDVHISDSDTEAKENQDYRIKVLALEGEVIELRKQLKNLAEKIAIDGLLGNIGFISGLAISDTKRVYHVGKDIFSDVVNDNKFDDDKLLNKNGIICKYVLLNNYITVSIIIKHKICLTYKTAKRYLSFLVEKNILTSKRVITKNGLERQYSFTPEIRLLTGQWMEKIQNDFEKSNS